MSQTKTFDRKLPDFQKEVVKIQNLGVQYMQLTEVNNSNENKILDFEREQTDLKEYVSNMQNENFIIKEQQIEWQRKLEAINQRQVPNDTSNNLKIFCMLLNFYVSERWHNDLQIVTCHFDNDCNVKFAIRCTGGQDLLSIEPKHPNFESLRDFLSETQDCKGLLISLQKYFKYLKSINSSPLR